MFFFKVRYEGRGKTMWEEEGSGGKMLGVRDGNRKNMTDIRHTDVCRCHNETHCII